MEIHIMNYLRLLFLLTVLILVIHAVCQKKDTTMSPEQEAEYQRLVNQSLANHPPPTYEQLKEENQELKDKEIERAMER